MSDESRKVSDMKPITARMLSRETARILDQVAAEAEPLTIFRDGHPVARLVPISQAERNLYDQLLASGVDPDSPPPLDPSIQRLPAPLGDTTASEHLQRERDSYYDGQ